ncbi:hypothetical protein B0H17DRAFT_1078182, partial [Mycena rosella]
MCRVESAAQASDGQCGGGAARAGSICAPDASPSSRQVARRPRRIRPVPRVCRALPSKSRSEKGRHAHGLSGRGEAGTMRTEVRTPPRARLWNAGARQGRAACCSRGVARGRVRIGAPAGALERDDALLVCIRDCVR